VEADPGSATRNWGQAKVERRQFWINLQSRYDLAVVEQNIGAKVIAEVKQATV
jgi:plasmid maintenance system antidote protein VapI